MQFDYLKDSFKINNNNDFLLSGESHYFRIAPSEWNKHLDKIKDAGIKAVSTYIPWSWHESSEGEFDFEGKTNPNKNLIGWLDTVKNKGLLCVVKPGPYILAEYEDKGIPPWLTEKKEIMAKKVDMVTYMHSKYLEYVGKWYDKVLDILRPYQKDQGGPIIFMQVCNEIGLFNWLEGSADYSEVVIKYYREYLKDKFKSIDKLNKVYSEKNSSFKDISAPYKAPSNSWEFVKWMDFHKFHRHYFARYISSLEKEIRKRGITVPLYHNIAGWVYGHALEYPVNISMYREIAKNSPEILLGTDLIPENISYRNIHHGPLVIKATSSLKQGKELSYVAEMQAGTREDNVITYPCEMELFYKQSIINGVKGINLYMFSQGKNPPRKGEFGPTFYWQTALDYKGEELPLYKTVSRLGKFLSNFGNEITKTNKKADIAVAFYWPYWDTEFFYPLFKRKTLIEPEKIGIDFDPKQIRDSILVDTWIKLLTWRNTRYDIVDIQTISQEELSSYKKVIALTLPFMEGNAQQKLVSYVENGGDLFFAPSIPCQDDNFKECNILGKSFGIQKGHKLAKTKIDIKGYEHIACIGPIYSIKADKPFETISVSAKEKEICGIQKEYGKGSLTYLSSVFCHSTAEHADIFYQILGENLLQGNIKYSNPNILASYNSNWLFAANVHSHDIEGIIEIEDLKIPLNLAPKESILVPINLSLPCNKGKILYSTADVIDINIKNDNSIEIELYREKDASSQILMDISFVPKRISFNNMEIPFSKENNGKILIEIKKHNGKVEKMKIKL